MTTIGQNMETTTVTPGDTLDPKDAKTILYLYRQNVHAVNVIGLPPGTPFLLTGWRAKRARGLALRGFVKDHGGISPASPDMLSATVTTTGVAAYNAAIAKTAGA